MKFPNSKPQTAVGARGKRVWNVAFLLVLGICLSFVICDLVLPRRAQGAGPTTSPATQIANWFTKLADRDPNVRDQARIDLMGLSRGDLSALRRYVKEHRPLAPAQAAALRDIVAHVFLAGEEYRPDEDHGFLGVWLSDGSFSGAIQPEADPTTPPPLGVVIVDRLPGLCAFRVLTNGDMIVGMTEHSEVPIRTASDLRSLISQTRAGETIHLEVFRGGRIVQIPVTLSPRPAGVETFDFLRERQRRVDLADEYWQREFAPLVDDGVS